nr:MAG TPA: hypothetical protein [Caudoviricetes sp.]
MFKLWKTAVSCVTRPQFFYCHYPYRPSEPPFRRPFLWGGYDKD